jgi:glyoxylase-like metal-dependent hydrolase (beta-lactamase superfamily II)
LQPDRVLEDGATVATGDLQLKVIATPGHCANHRCFGVVGTPWMLSGDHVMGWNSTLVSVPDGSMADYLDSLRKVIALPYRSYLPAHGGPIEDGPARARALLAHREARNEEVIRAVAAGARRIGELVGAIYPELGLSLVPAARMTLTAHVEYLEARGLLRVRRGLAGAILAPAATPPPRS